MWQANLTPAHTVLFSVTQATNPNEPHAVVISKWKISNAKVNCKLENEMQVCSYASTKVLRTWLDFTIIEEEIKG